MKNKYLLTNTYYLYLHVSINTLLTKSILSLKKQQWAKKNLLMTWIAYLKKIKKKKKESTNRAATFLIETTLLEAINSIAYWERIRKKDIINKALKNYINEYEKKKGSLQPIPN